jgi:hypothetical protein
MTHPSSTLVSEHIGDIVAEGEVDPGRLLRTSAVASADK